MAASGAGPGPGGAEVVAPHGVGGPGAARRAELSGRSSLDGGGYEFKRVVHRALGPPRPAGSALGGRPKPLLSLSDANGGTRQSRALVARQPGARRLPAWLGFAGEARRRAGCPPPAENYSARRPLRAAPTFPASRRYRLPPVSEEPDPARPRGAAAAGKGGAAGGGRPREAAAGWSGAAPAPSRAEERRPRSLAAPSRPVRSRRRGGGAAHEVKMVIRVFVASSSGSVAIKKRQQDVVRFLEANRIEFEEVDITMSEEKRQWMYKNIPEDRQPAQGNPLPPQIFSDDRYCGDYDGFFESKESNTVFSFLGLKPTLASKESEP